MTHNLPIRFGEQFNLDAFARQFRSLGGLEGLVEEALALGVQTLWALVLEGLVEEGLGTSVLGDLALEAQPEEALALGALEGLTQNSLSVHYATIILLLET